MLTCVVKQSSAISAMLNVLVRNQDTILKLTKFQVFLIMCHLFLGTFPSQLYSEDMSFGKLMTVNNDEDELTCKTKLALRLNKLKAIVRYFCLFYKRVRENKDMAHEIVAFQRYSSK